MSSLHDADDFFAIGIFGIVLYSVIWIFALFTFMWTLVKSKPCLSVTVPRLVLVFLLGFLTVRVAWLLLKTFDGETDTTFTLNRIAFCFYFTSFSMVVFHWADVYHSNYIQSTSEAHQKFLPTVKWIVVILLYYLRDQKREGDLVYEANIIVDVSASFTVSVLFLLYGIRLFVIRRPEVSSVWGGMQDVWKVLGITVAFTLCFMLRVVLFLYRPVTGEYMDIFVFNLFGYYLPETIPVLLQVYLIQTSKRKALEETEFIESLYRESSSDREDEAFHVNQTEVLYFAGSARTRSIDVHTECNSDALKNPAPRGTSRS